MDARVLTMVELERERQELRKSCGEWEWTLADRAPTHEQKLPVLGEEMGEVNTAVLKEDELNLAEELTQLAACSIAWLESLMPSESAREES